MEELEFFLVGLNILGERDLGLRKEHGVDDLTGIKKILELLVSNKASDLNYALMLYAIDKSLKQKYPYAAEGYDHLAAKHYTN